MKVYPRSRPASGSAHVPRLHRIHAPTHRNPKVPQNNRVEIELHAVTIQGKKNINITLSDQRPQPLVVILARPHHYRRTASCDKLRRKKPNQIPTTQRPSHIARRWHLRWLRALQQRTIPNGYSSTQTRASISSWLAEIHKYATLKTMIMHTY